MAYLITFIKIVLVADAILLVIAVILQSGKGGGLAGAFGASSPTESAFSAKTGLTKITWWLAGIFFVLCLTLSLLPIFTQTGLTAKGQKKTDVKSKVQETPPDKPGAKSGPAEKPDTKK